MADIRQPADDHVMGIGSAGVGRMSIGPGGIVLIEKSGTVRPLEVEQEEMWKAGSPVQMHCPLCGEDAACIETQEYGICCGPCWLDRKFAAK